MSPGLFSLIPGVLIDGRVSWPSFCKVRCKVKLKLRSSDWLVKLSSKR